MPGCARSKKENGVDWILWRTLCDLKISSDDINHMGLSQQESTLKIFTTSYLHRQTNQKSETYKA